MKTSCDSCDSCGAKLITGPGYATSPFVCFFCKKQGAVGTPLKELKDHIPPTPTVLPSVTMFCQDGKSDKVYKIWIEHNSITNWYYVKAAYGRRGSIKLTQVTKQESYLYAHALYHYKMLIEEKSAKGYIKDEQAAKKKALKAVLPIPTWTRCPDCLLRYNHVEYDTCPVCFRKMVSKPLPAPKKETFVPQGPTGRRIKEID